ncbi:MAG TPA: cation:proton antiporter [Ornithinibacter sp.]|nr:cation:proton antiporter [Ornithinibacter sp.]HQD68127.1 cation:proton antiporter [Ornithinibacter sp.]
MTPDAAIVLTAAFAAGLVARVLRLPPLLGFLAAGFALAGADAVGSGADLGRPPVIDLLADLGVTLLLFAVGLHLDVRRLLRREVWLTTGVHSLLMVGIGVGFLTALSALGVAEASGLDLRALALIALALSFSSTVFVVKVLDERNESRSRYGQIAIGVLVVQDVFAVVFVAVSHGSPPSPWAFGLLLLIPARRVIVALWERAGRAELQVLFGVLMAFVPGYALFDALGLKGDLGALAMGMLLAGAARSDDLAKSIFGVKELLLVAFFLSIGLHGVPDLQQVLTAALLLLLLPVQTLAYVVLLSMLRMRRRTAVLTALVLANSSEFALVVMATAQDAGLVTERWVTTTAVTVALSFVLSSAVNAKAEQISDAIERRWPDPDPESLDEAERPIPLHDVDALVLGMGRVGSAAHRRLTERGLRVLGIEHDEARVARLQAQGVEVVLADATDSSLWRRLVAVRTLRTVVLAMPFHEANLATIEVVRARSFTGTVAAVARYDDEVTELHANGANTVLHVYSGSGVALADAALDGPEEALQP